MNIESSVLERYSQGAETAQPSLCCAVDYDKKLLDLLPEEVIAKDYGCGDPSRYVREGDTVLDLGSGSGKICYIAAQLVGNSGQVIGVDMNDDMLALARSYQSEMAEKIGSDRVCFVKGQIQDLSTDLDAMDRYLVEHPVGNWKALSGLKSWQTRQRIDAPLINDESVDLVVSNCVLNLVDDIEKLKLMQEIFRVTKPGGRIAISDIVSDTNVPAHLKSDSELWSGCISGAMQEHDFVQAFVDAGFQAVRIDKWDVDPWQTVEGIEFRAVTVTAVKPQAKQCSDQLHEVIYTGPFAKVFDDEGVTYIRGERISVGELSYAMIADGPYQNDFVGISTQGSAPTQSCCSPAGSKQENTSENNVVSSGSSCCS